MTEEVGELRVRTTMGSRVSLYARRRYLGFPLPPTPHQFFDPLSTDALYRTGSGIRERRSSSTPPIALRQKARCRAPSLQRCWISSSITYVASQQRSKRVASPPNHGFIERGNAFLLTSSLVPRAPTSNRGWKHFRILRTHPLTTHGHYPFALFTVPQSSKPHVRIHFPPFVVLCTWT